MHRYSSAQGNMVGPCPCGVFHGHNNHCSSASFLYPGGAAAAHLPYHDYSNSSSSSVDCTLSLGTPSTRRTSFSAGDSHHHPTHDRRSGGSRLSNFCWDFLQNNSRHHSSAKSSSSSNHRPPTATVAGESLLARRCANCDTTSTPLWRNGPRGPKSLCNACGIRYKKEERRASAAAATNGGAGGMMDSHHEAGYNYGGAWGAHPGQKVQYLSPAGNEFRFIDDVVSDSGRDSDSGMQFLSWRLNVTDRPTSQLVYDFTR